MKALSTAPIVYLTLLLTVPTTISSQGIPDDPNHLPKMIGGPPAANSRIDSMIVSGKVRIDGIPADQPRPVMYVAVYSVGRFISRRQVSANGSYTVTDVPRDGEATVVVEIDQVEVARHDVIPSPASILYQDFDVSWLQVEKGKTKPGVVNASQLYERTTQDQERFDRGLSALSKGQNDEAIAAFLSVVGHDAKDFHAWTQLGNAYFLKKDNKKAGESYTRAIAEGPEHVLAYLNLGKLRLSDKDYDGAIEVLSKAITVDASSADAQEYLGEAYLGIKKGSKAVGYLNEAIRLAPIEKAEVHLRLAALYDGAGLKPRASLEYQAFLEKVPNYKRRDELKKYIADNPPNK
jgi:Tfp pilus assembly protein PilF